MSVLEQGIYFIEGKTLTEVSNEIKELPEEEAANTYPENRLFRYRPNINLKQEDWGLLPDVEQEIVNNQIIMKIHSTGRDRIIKQYIKYVHVTNPDLKVIGTDSFIREELKYESIVLTIEGINADINLEKISNLEVVIWCHNRFTNCAKVYLSSKSLSESLDNLPLVKEYDREFIDKMHLFSTGEGKKPKRLYVNFETLENGSLVSLLKNEPVYTKHITINLNKTDLQVTVLTEDLDSFISPIIDMCFYYCNYLWI